MFLLWFWVFLVFLSFLSFVGVFLKRNAREVKMASVLDIVQQL